MNHLFFFSPGDWIGEGKILFSLSPDTLRFHTEWQVLEMADKEIRAVQKVGMSGTEETLVNEYRVFHVTPAGFSIELSNELLGQAVGQGIIDDKQIAWEFRGHPNFEGFEIYRRIGEDEYSVHAEYSSPDQNRTIIDGRVWKRKQAL